MTPPLIQVIELEKDGGYPMEACIVFPRLNPDVRVSWSLFLIWDALNKLEVLSATQEVWGPPVFRVIGLDCIPPGQSTLGMPYSQRLK